MEVPGVGRTATTAESVAAAAGRPELAVRQARAARMTSILLSYGILVAISCITVVPLFWALSTSVKSYKEVVAFPIVLWPADPKWQNYVIALTSMDFLLNLRNTVIIAVGPALAMIISASLVAYGFAKGQSPARDALFVVVLATMMLPGFVTFIPIFVMFHKFNLVNTFGPFLIPPWFGGGAWNIFLLRQFFKTIPDELLDAARIDGSSELRILGQICVPLAKPALATIFLFSVMGGWNNYFGPFIYLTKRKLHPFSLALYRLRFEVTTTMPAGVDANMSQNIVMAASLVVVLPILFLFLFTQRYFIEGIAITGMKG